MAVQISSDEEGEWGTVQDEAGFRDLLAMDSYQAVRDGVRYPAVLCITGLTDPRVAPFHAAKFAARDGAASFDRPIPVTRAGLDRMRDICTPEERCRLILCDEDGTPREPAALWLTEVGQPVRPNSWEVIFTRACKRCAQNGFPLSISPHQLRHAFAVHMLALLIQQRLREAALPVGPVESYRLILGDPLQQVQRLLGHASLTTTYIYLDHIATRADTVDAAVEELLALLPGPQGV